MDYNVYFFKKTNSKKVVAIQLIKSHNRIELLVKEKEVFGQTPKARIYSFFNILSTYDLSRLGYAAISANEYRLIRSDVLNNLNTTGCDGLPF